MMGLLSFFERVRNVFLTTDTDEVMIGCPEEALMTSWRTGPDDIKGNRSNNYDNVQNPPHTYSAPIHEDHPTHSNPMRVCREFYIF